jgi:hypothetical protein
MLPPAPALDAITTTGGFLLVLSIVVPVAGVLLAFVLGDRYVRLVACATIPLGLAIAVAILVVLPEAATAGSSAARGWIVGGDDRCDCRRDLRGRRLCHS